MHIKYVLIPKRSIFRILGLVVQHGTELPYLGPQDFDSRFHIRSQLEVSAIQWDRPHIMLLDQSRGLQTLARKEYSRPQILTHWRNNYSYPSFPHWSPQRTTTPNGLLRYSYCTQRHRI